MHQLSHLYLHLHIEHLRHVENLSKDLNYQSDHIKIFLSFILMILNNPIIFIFFDHLTLKIHCLIL